jgi:hypothetical protein
VPLKVKFFQIITNKTQNNLKISELGQLGVKSTFDLWHLLTKVKRRLDPQSLCLVAALPRWDCNISIGYTFCRQCRNFSSYISLTAMSAPAHIKENPDVSANIVMKQI